MKYTVASLKYTLLSIYCLYSFSAYAFDSKASEQEADLAIKKLYHTLNSMPNTSIINRIEWVSNQFKGKPYLYGALGEGPNALYDQFPTYRVDAFDCETYVDTVVALALSNSLKSFQQRINSIRYKNGTVSYINRNHFTSLDWNINNQKNGIIKDITLSIHDNKNQHVAVWAKALINKPSWYAHKNVKTIRLQYENQRVQEQRLSELKQKGSRLKRTVAKIPYLPFTALFSENGNPNLYLFSQIPHGAIIEIVRPNWDLRAQIGTALNVSHLGFAIWKNNQLYFREASSEHHKVVDVLLIDYLKKASQSPTIKGINVQVLVPQGIIESGVNG